MNINKRLLAALALTGMMAGTLVAPGAASATTITPHVSATKTISRTHVTISGSVSPNARHRRVYLQRIWGGRWHNLTSQLLNYSSHYAFTVSPTARGTYSYRVHRPAQAGRRSAVSRIITVTVQTRGWAIFRSYSGLGDWQSSTVRIPSRDYKLAYSFTCQRNYLPFWAYSWMAQGDGYESAWIEPPSGGYGRSGVWYGHGGAQSGYFKIATQSDCHWSFKIYRWGWR